MDEDCLKALRLCRLQFCTAMEFPDNAKDLDALFQQNLKGTIVIEDFEELTNSQKHLLINALSTANGKFGISKKVEIRVAFTSSKAIDELRAPNDLVPTLLWDRISQLIVEFPSFQQEGVNIQADFANTWDKMKFHQIKEYEGLSSQPHLEGLSYFLKAKHSEFAGGFRDLDKIACLYFNYRIFHYGNEKRISNEIEEKVLADVKADFLGKTQMKDDEPSADHIFDFNEVRPSSENRKHPTLDDFNNQFRIQFRKWLLEKHKTLSKAASNLDCSIHTLKNYKEGRATKSKREARGIK